MSQRDERKTAVAYLRVSSEEQAEGLSLESQETKIREWCASKDFEIIAMFRDEGESAYNDEIAKRPQFAALLGRLPDLRPNIVVVSSLDRWARSTVVSSQTFRLLAELQIGFASVTEAMWDFSNPASRLILGVLANFAEFSSASTGEHVRRVADLKFEKGLHRGSIPFGYRPDPASTRGDPRPPTPDEREHPAVVELFQRALPGAETCYTLAKWLNRQGFTTHNHKRTVLEEQQGEPAKPRRFTADSVQGILTNPFYAGFIVRQRRTRKGTPSAQRELRRGLHRAAVSEEDFNRVQSILRSHYKAPRSKSPKLRPYLGKGLLRCYCCGETARCHHIKGLDYYQESSALRGIFCETPGRYWPCVTVDRQMDQIVKPIELPRAWKERALELANAENNLLDLRLLRRSLEGRHKRVVELYKDGDIDRVEYERESRIIQNQLKTVAPAEVTIYELSIADFERFGDIWSAATPEEKAELLGRMLDSYYVDFRTGQMLEIVPKPGFRPVFEATGITIPLTHAASGPSLTIGDPEGTRGRQSLTTPRWGGLLLAKVASPLSLLRFRPLPARRMNVPDSQLTLFT
jgi:DNA invertase Pin-like site-specific DNA recombinase